jgi:hypothetical protein
MRLCCQSNDGDFLTWRFSRGARVATVVKTTPTRPTQSRFAIVVPTSKVLVLAREPLAAALVGMLLELDTYEPAFAQPGETPEEAVQRVRPVLIILLDGSLEAADSDVFHGRARGATVVLFGTRNTLAHVKQVAEKRGLLWFSMPTDRATLVRAMREAFSAASTRSGRDRRRPTAHTMEDGTLIYRDRDGREWQVYDRRMAERRAHRAFVNDAGEEWHYPLESHEAGDTSADTLERQLRSAVRQISLD